MRADCLMIDIKAPSYAYNIRLYKNGLQADEQRKLALRSCSQEFKVHDSLQAKKYV